MDNKVLYAKQAFTRVQRVWFVGDCALKKGVGVCYELGFADSNETGQKVTDAYGLRSRAVMLPRSSTVKQFAGVIAQDYAAAPTPAGQPIDIVLPGGGASCRLAVSATCGSTQVQCQQQQHTQGGTVTGAVISGKTITLSGATFIAHGVLAGDVIFITAGTGVKPGGYTVASTPTSETVLTLVNAPGDYDGSTYSDLAWVVIERAHASGTFYDASASGVFVTNSGYGKSCAYAMQTFTYVATAKLILCWLEDGNDDTGVT